MLTIWDVLGAIALGVVLIELPCWIADRRAAHQTLSAVHGEWVADRAIGEVPAPRRTAPYGVTPVERLTHESFEEFCASELGVTLPGPDHE